MIEEINVIKPRLHFFICANDRTGTGSTMPSCGPRIKVEDVKAIKKWVRENGLGADIQCTVCKCLGFCNAESSVMCVYPEGKFIKGINNIEDIKEVIKQEIKYNALNEKNH